MPRVGGRSRGCRICRERKIKCDELAPQCLQCTSSGRQCPGPIIGALISDMTPKFVNSWPDSRSPARGNESEILPKLQHPAGDGTEIIAPPVAEITSSSATTELVTIGNAESLSRMALVNNAVKLSAEAVKFGATTDPFKTLPLDLGSKSAQQLFDYCANGMSSSLVPFGGIDPMQDVWLPWVVSDQLLLASTLFQASVQLSVLNPSAGVESAIWRGATLSLLNKRLASSSQPVNDITIASVLLLTHQSIASGDAEETKLHMDGLERMLRSRGSYSPMAPVQEILFWTDFVGSAMTHQPMRNYAVKPDNTLLPCVPVNLHPGTTISKVCVAFQPLLAIPLFAQLIVPLHEVRCLTIAFHFSNGKVNLEIPMFSQLCRSNRMKCQTLLKSGASDTLDLCLLAIMIFLDSVLLADNTDIPFLLKNLQTTFKSTTLAEVSQMDKKLMLWLLYVGSAAAQDVEPASWFRRHFANTLAILHVSSLEAAKVILVEFLWVDGACDLKLAEIWKLFDIEPLGSISDDA